jgi:hypothetical protein
MVKNVILIAAYNKPDLLFIHLNQYGLTGRLSEFKVILYLDYGYDQEILDVVSHMIIQYGADIDVRTRPKTICPIAGYQNIIQSYLDVVNDVKDYVIIGEEDILPTQDCLDYADYCWEHFLKPYDKIFCVAHKRRPETELDGDPEIMIGDTQCTSPYLISKDTIVNHMVKYVTNPDYFTNPIQFNYYFFPNSRIGPQEHTHHDGAIERIIEAEGMFALKPDQARSMHVGLSGVFCGGNAPSGTLEERIKRYVEIINAGGDALRELSDMPQDMVVTSWEGPKWNKLKLDLDRDQARASSWWYDPENKFKQYIETVNAACV